MTYRISSNQQGVPDGKVRFEFDYRLLGKRYRKMLICQKSAARALYQRWEKQIVDGTGDNYSLFEKLDEYLIHAGQVKSDGAYRHERMIIENIVKLYFNKDTRLNDIKRPQIEDFAKWRRKCNRSKYSPKEDVSNSTINHSIAVLSSFFNWCIIREYYHAANPSFRTKLKENNMREIHLSKDQIYELLEKAKLKDKRLYRTIIIALCTGMRFGEILSLTWSEIDFNNSRLCLSRLKTKGKRARIVPMITTLRSVLLELKNSNPTSETVLNVSPNLIRMQWKRLRPTLSFSIIEDGSKFRFHDLRHVVAQFLIDNGVPLEDVQAILGHQDFTTTQRRYAMFARPDLLEKAEVIENLFTFKRVV